MLHGVRDVFAEHIAAKRKRQACCTLPPFAKIDQFLKTRARISELAFVNDQTGVGAPVFYRLENLIKRHDDVLEIVEINFQCEISAGHPARYRDHPFAQPIAKIDI